MAVSPSRTPITLPTALITRLQLVATIAAPEPVYSRIANALEEAIKAGQLPTGCLLPSSGDLGRLVHTSATRVNAAVALLEKRGLVARVRGIGAYVLELQQQAAPEGIYEQLEPTDGAEIVRHVQIDSGPASAEGEESSVISRTLVRCGQPIAHLRSAVPISRHHLQTWDVTAHGLYPTLETLRLNPRRVLQEVVARPIRQDELTEFQADRGSCILELTRESSTQDGHRVETATHRYLAAHFKLRSTLLT